MTPQTTKWATLVYDPKAAKSNLPDAKPELMAGCDIDGEKVYLYWVASGLCDFLRKGDTVMVEWVKGKWKISKTQAPELMATLEQRRSSATAAPSDAPTTRQGNGDDVAEMAAIAQALQAALPDWTEQAIASLSCTIFIQRGKRTA